jgi:thiamine biosynthesis protein ThiI
MKIERKLSDRKRIEMSSLWMLRYGEIFLKSPPVRDRWEKTLINNIKEQFPDSRIWRERGRIWLTGEIVPEKLSRIFGLVSFSECTQCSYDELPEVSLDYCRKAGLDNAKTFAFRVKRVGNHTLSSQQIAEKLGAMTLDIFPHLQVNLGSPEKEIFIEIREDRCYLFNHVYRGAGGLPLGVEGKLVALVSGGIDSPVASWMMMKRGCRIIPLYVSLEGFLDAATLERTEAVVEALRAYQPDLELVVVRDGYLSAAKDILLKEGQERHTCLLCKRRMYRIAAEVARITGAKGFVTGESLGQVASQTLDNQVVLTEAASIPVYRPLIAYDKEETVSLAKKIGTYELSILPTGGCGAVPKKPATKAKLEDVRAMEDRVIESVDKGVLTIPLIMNKEPEVTTK